jgi:hypothetical protein
MAAIVWLWLTGCSSQAPKVAATVNESAGLSGDLPADPLQWQVITASIDKTASTISTVYGNELAVEYARTHSQHEYPDGAVLSLVTWSERDDPRYFGAKIPGEVKSVEFVFVGAARDGRPAYLYEKYAGRPLKRVAMEQGQAIRGDAEQIVGLRAAVMP